MHAHAKIENLGCRPTVQVVRNSMWLVSLYISYLLVLFADPPPSGWDFVREKRKINGHSIGGLINHRMS